MLASERAGEKLRSHCNHKKPKFQRKYKARVINTTAIQH